jgi:hypothetical protein
VARLLLANALSATGGAPVQVTVPTDCRSLLQEFGFQGTQDRMRMELGEARAACLEGLAHYATTPYLAT